MTVSQWADADRRLSAESSSEPGRYSTSRTEYARAIMDAFNDPAVEEVVACTSAQVSKTTILENVIAYHMVHSPAPVMVVMPTLDLAEAFSKDRLSPMLRDTRVLRGKVVDTGSRKAGNTLLHKKFPGGHITICGANSEASLSSRPIKIVLGDEVDRWETTSEGDPGDLVRTRTTAFFDAKVGWFSTPKLAGGPIESLYEASDRGKFWIPCPAGCDQHFVLRFAHLKWEEGQAAPASDGRRVRFAERAWWVSPCCEREFDDLAKDRAIRRGAWRSEQPFRGRRGFWLWAGYSPFMSASKIADRWLAAQSDASKLQVFVNTVLGEGWRDRGEAPDWERLSARREGYVLGQIPLGVLVLTAGIDVQKDRFAISVWGWGRGKQRWLVEHDELPCDTSNQASYDELTRRIERVYEHPSGESMRIVIAGIDDGYAVTQTQVRTWARQHAGRVLLLKGYDHGQGIIALPSAVDVTVGGRRLRRGVKLWPLNVTMCKHDLYGALRQPVPADGESFGPGYVHLAADTPDEYLRQLVAEEYVPPRDSRKGYWQKIRERNEALDCHNMARGCAEQIGISRWGERDWRKLEASLRVTAAPPVLQVSADPGEPQGMRESAPAVVAAVAQRRRGFVISRPSW